MKSYEGVNMDVDRVALLVGHGESHLSTIVSQLENLKLEVTKTHDHEEFPNLLGGKSKLALIAVDAHGLDELRGRQVFTEIKQNQPETPVMWICPPGVLAPNHRTELPDAIVESDASSNFVILRLQQLLINRFFPRIVANAMKFSARSALLQSFKTEVQVMQEYVRVEKTALAEISSVISFSGPGTTGSVVVSGSEAFFKNTCDKILPTDRAVDPDEAAALAGEMCNTVVGKFKAFLVQNGMKAEISCPLTVRGDTTSLEYGAGALSLVTRLTDQTESLFVELVLDMFNVNAIQPNIKQKILEPGGLSFF
jgi:CheY-specific phosphatase CheX/CheY-like chemotaxis protein